MRTHRRVAAIYDVHANLPALEAVLREIEQASVDLILVGGDIVWGPFPRETLDLLAALGNTANFIRGNADREVGGRLDTTAGFDEMTADINVWAADQLTSQQREWLMALPITSPQRIQGLGDVLFCHGSPRSDEEMITPMTPPDRLREALSIVPHRTVVCGHTHMQFQTHLEGKHVVNAGSVGLPYQGLTGAYWGLFGPEVELRRTEYDTEAAAASMKRTACPHVEEAFVDYILRPPSAKEVAAHFESIALTKRY